MAGRITPGPNVSGLDDNFAASFVTASDGKPALAVTNTDGTSISSGGGGGGGAATIADGADVTQGAIADASVTAGATGTVSAKLRRISTDVGSILTNTPAAGQAAMAASSPVVIASNQSAVPVTLTSTTITGTVAATQSGTWAVGANSATGSAVPANAFYVAATNSSGNLTGVKDNSMNDGQASGVLSSQSVVYNGTTSDKSRSATSASGTTGTGVPAAGSMGFDGTNYQRIKTDTSGNVSVNPSSATGSTVPANAFYIGGMTSTGNLNAVNMMNQTANVTGNGVIQSGQMGQFDDVSPTAVTENQFGNLRMSANRNAYTTIRDAAGNERGVNVNANNAASVAGDIASAATDSGNPVKVGGKYNASNITLTDAQRGDIQLDVNGFLRSTLATLIAGEDLTNNVLKVEQRFSYTHIAAGQATTTIKSGAGFLHSITLNGAASATNVTTVYDSTTGSGTVIAIPAATTATVPTTLTYDVAFTTGLTIVTATANGADMTISWR